MKSSDPLSDLMLVQWDMVLLVQDNAQFHVARVCRQFLDDEGIDATDRSSHSPDLNPIENL